MRDIVLISYTSLNAGGGVPRWNRDFIAGFPGTKHYSFDDVARANPGFSINPPEWDRAHILNQWLIWSKKIKKSDIIIVDGFWGLGLDGYNVISIAHGIWSHLTKDDVDAGKQPEFPVHNTIQVKYRRDHLARGGKIVAVSDFISEQMLLQWGFTSTVINNAIDLDKFKPSQVFSDQPRKPLIIHGVTTANKGFDHIDAVKKAVPQADVLLLDDAAEALRCGKYEALAQADLVVQPSAYEGNSYFVLETLACDVPIIAYNVGLLYSISRICKCAGDKEHCCIGSVIDRKLRSPEITARQTKFILESVLRDRSPYNPRHVAEKFSIQKFHTQWKGYLKDYERNLKG